MVAYEAYYTPEDISELIPPFIPEGSVIFDPCAGTGNLEKAFYNEKYRAEYSLFYSDITELSNPNNTHPRDATQFTFWKHWEAHAQFDWVVINPPFSEAHLILPFAWRYTKQGIVALLNLTWLEPCRNRGDFLHHLSDHIVAICPVNPRPRFIVDGKAFKGSDRTTCFLLVARKDWSWIEKDIVPPFQFYFKHPS